MMSFPVYRISYFVTPWADLGLSGQSGGLIIALGKIEITMLFGFSRILFEEGCTLELI